MPEDLVQALVDHVWSDGKLDRRFHSPQSLEYERRVKEIVDEYQDLYQRSFEIAAWGVWLSMLTQNGSPDFVLKEGTWVKEIKKC
jgi:hypothetical protein